MGRRGPAPKSGKEKKLRGNPGKRTEPKPEVVATSSAAPTCPAWLPPAAKVEWRRASKEILLTRADLAPFAAYCIAWAELQEATETLKKDGRVFFTDSGYPVPHPAVAMQRSAWAAVKLYSSMFGLDPISRGRLGSPKEAAKEDPFTAFLNRGKTKTKG